MVANAGLNALAVILGYSSGKSNTIENQFEEQPEPAILQKAKTRITKKNYPDFPVQKKDLLPMIASEESSG